MQSNTKTLVIAEAGVNHNGSLELALQLIEAASEAGADIVKFQTFSADQLATPILEMAHYQKANCERDQSQYEMLKNLELPIEYYPKLIEHCHRHNILFMSSVFDHRDVPFLQSLNMPFFKIPSGEITNGPLLLEVAKTQMPMIVSTGMATLGEIEQALMVIAFGYARPNEAPSIEAFQQVWQQKDAHTLVSKKVTLLHCTSNYPTPLQDVHMCAMNTLANAFNVDVGYSDHTHGSLAAIVAVARGAKVIEKHFTLDKDLPGPDHKASLTPTELREMVHAIRNVETLLGSPIKHRTAAEESIVQVVRKSLVAGETIHVGDRFTEKNLTLKRAGSGISPMLFWEQLGKVSRATFQKSETIV